MCYCTDLSTGHVVEALNELDGGALAAAAGPD